MKNFRGTHIRKMLVQEANSLSNRSHSANEAEFNICLIAGSFFVLPLIVASIQQDPFRARLVVGFGAAAVLMVAVVLAMVRFLALSAHSDMHSNLAPTIPSGRLKYLPGLLSLVGLTLFLTLNIWPAD
jgi:4-amino-4-deoxy-L-arabinose transferase-like glycosyltransferase